jgi:hypothetical protein
MHLRRYTTKRILWLVSLIIMENINFLTTINLNKLQELPNIFIFSISVLTLPPISLVAVLHVLRAMAPW